MIDNNKVVSILQSIIDPSSGRDIISQRLVTNLKVEGNSVSFSLQMPKATPDDKGKVFMACEERIKKEYPNAEVNVHMETQKAAGNTKNPLPQIQNIIAVGSGKGGVGKSTVSLNLTKSLANMGFKVGIMDADLYGPSIPTMLGISDQRPKVREVYGKHKLLPIEKDGIYAISIGNIIDAEQAVVLRGPRLGGIIKQFVYDCIWPDLDFLIIDLPPGTGDIQLTLVQSLAITGAIMVTTPQEVAVKDAVKAGNMFLLPNVNVPILGVVENMSWFTPEEDPTKKYYIFGEGGGAKLANYLKTALLGNIPLVAKARENGDLGKIAVTEVEVFNSAFNSLRDTFLKQLAIRKEMLAPSKRVEMEN